MTSYKISIVILNWNGKKDTLECLHSLESLSYPNYETIVVDNGSRDDSIEVIKKEFPKVTLLMETENLGFAGGCNVGIRYALNHGADAVCLLNNDTVVDPHFLQAFVDRMQKEPTVGILGAKIYMYTERNRLDHIGGMWNKEKAEFTLIGNRALDSEICWDESHEIDYVCGAAFFVKKEVFEKIGLLEEKFFLIWEESDFCFRAKRAGFAIKVCLQAKLFHKVSASFKSKAHSTYFWWRNRLYWIDRNCSTAEKKEIFRKVLKKEIFHLWKIKTIKSFELFVLTRVLGKKAPYQKAEKLHKYKAALQGIHDSRKGTFGKGPSWIYQKPNIK